MRTRLVVVALLLATLVVTAAVFPSGAEAQCAMCRSAFDSPEGRRMIRYYQLGIVFLLAAPLAAFGTVAYLAVRGKRRLDESHPAHPDE